MNTTEDLEYLGTFKDFQTSEDSSSANTDVPRPDDSYKALKMKLNQKDLDLGMKDIEMDSLRKKN